ncbi:MAG: molybdopterin-dependent oxidoreductase [Bryobacteraceae bacterium]|nr:molybdopterin-dependent oxidoreductase [Bryobacteraceae bacterium]
MTATEVKTVTLTIDGQEVTAPEGALLIDVCKSKGTEVPAFCYYEGYSLQAACRMCLVEIEKFPKLQASCTIPVAQGMVVKTESEQVVAARKDMLEFLLSNHPLDCPVCDKGGECELQDMTFRYGAGESRFTEIKVHTPEKQWSPVVYFDAPRCILCYRCVRACGEGMGVGALGVQYRGVVAEIVPNMNDHLNCDECGACIDICPVGALTSGMYRYKTRPWEMTHVGTICTHCSNGCKTTLGVKNDEIIRGNNRDRSGINDEFLCVKGRYAFDFNRHEARLTSPMVRKDGKLVEVPWSEALATVAKKFSETVAAGGTFGVVGSVHTTNEENYFLQKFARHGLKTANLDHQRTGDVPALVDALSIASGSVSGTSGSLATASDLYQCSAALVIGSDLSQQHPFLAWQLRANGRHHQARVYTVTPGPVREDAYSVAQLRYTDAASMSSAIASLHEKLKGERDLVILFGDAIKGADVKKLVEFGSSLGIPVKYVALVDYSNSRGAMDMGLLPHLAPGYKAAPAKGHALPEMVGAGLDVMWVVGAETPATNAKFTVVQDLFLTETAARADVVLPSASAYEKSGTVTSVCGEVQRLKPAVRTMGTKPDLEIMGLIAREMKLNLGIWTADKVFDEIRSSVPGYNVPLAVLQTGGAPQAQLVNGAVPLDNRPELVASAGDTMFTSGKLGRYSKTLTSVIEYPGKLYGPQAGKAQ